MFRQKKTPTTLPVTGSVFSITIPDSEEFYSLVLGVLTLLTDEAYWIDDGGLTVEETVQAFLEAFLGARYT